MTEHEHEFLAIRQGARIIAAHNRGKLTLIAGNLSNLLLEWKKENPKLAIYHRDPDQLVNILQKVLKSHDPKKWWIGLRDIKRWERAISTATQHYDILTREWKTSAAADAEFA